MTQLRRKQKRSYLTRSTHYKRVKSLGFNHPEKIAYRDAINNQREDIFAKNIEKVRNNLSETMAVHENLIKSKLVSHNVSQQDIDAYLEKWVDVNFWPAPKNVHTIRRELNKLNKKYFS